VKEIKLQDGSLALASDGAPSDCVALAVLGLVSNVDLVVSGINPNPNVGHDVTYSGTVTAAMEAVIWGLPGLAVSLESTENHLGEVDYRPAAEIARKVAKSMLENQLPPDTVLNLNIPGLSLSEIKGLQITRQGLRVYNDELLERSDPRGVPYYWIGGDPPSGIPDQGTDIGAIMAGYASLTPLKLDLTATGSMQTLEEIFQD
jgi:5'-nucleotidase